MRAEEAQMENVGKKMENRGAKERNNLRNNECNGSKI